MEKINKILFPTDFSENSNYAFDYALVLAKKFGARLYILHVIHELIDTTGYYIPNISLDQLQSDLVKGAEEMTGKFIREKMGDFKDYETINTTGLPHIEILNMAKEKEMDMIVMGTHGRTGIDRVLFGSTAEKVVKKASCPVLTVRHPEKQ
ncbi:MAG TPA: universal stress protein [Thermodesulfobacteriota bacterium]|nr:universal stress protein [Thermodesulfobacteriota bacterium]